MKVTSSEIEGSQVVLEMEIEAERLEASMEKAYRHLASHANIPGFRRGKAPRAMVERMVGREALMEEALEILIPKAYQEAVEETGIDPVGQPKLDVVSAEPLMVKATVPVRPKVTLGDYRSIRQSLEVPEITEAQVEDALQTLREQRAEWVPAEREAQAGDLVTMDIVARSDEDTFLNEQAASVVVTPEREILAKGVVEQILGMKAGDRKAFDVTLPEDFARKEVAGKEAAIEVAVSEVKAKQVPELDDEFAKSIGDYGDVAAVRTAIREELEQQSRSQARRSLEDSVLTAVVDLAEAEPPTPWVDEQAAGLRENTQSQIKREGISFDQFLQFSNLTEDAFNEDTRTAAKRQLKRALVLDAVATAEGIDLTDDELNAAMEMAMASRQGRTVSPDEQARLRTNLRSAMKERKTIDRLVQIAEGQEEVEAAEASTPETGSAKGEALLAGEAEASTEGQLASESKAKDES